MALKVLSALDSAKPKFYHFKAIIVAGMGLFTDSYDLFCIPPIMILLGRIYYDEKSQIPGAVAASMVAIALLGAVIGMLVFGRLGDIKGRRYVYGLALTLMVLSSFGCGFSMGTKKIWVLLSLGFFRFLLGVGIGGDYPLSATIMSEFANKTTRGAFIAAVFSMQGFGILASSAVTMVVCLIFDRASKETDKITHTPEEADIAWRLILMLGSIPAALTFYWRMLMPETARYTALVERNVPQAVMDMQKVLEVSLSQIAEDYPLQPQHQSSYPLLSKQFFRRHGRDLFSCSISWFLIDIVFYSSNLIQSQIYLRYLNKKNGKMSAYDEAFRVALLQGIVALCSTIPGYFFTVYFIDRIGRKNIQKMGFLFLALVYFAIGIPYYFYWGTNTNPGFIVLYGLAFFFANFGPNTTTFIVPAELFPARFRTTCHGISGAIGKLGAIIGSVGFLWASRHDKGKGGDQVMSNEELIKMDVSLIMLGGVCILGWLVTKLFMRETMGRSLEDNEKENEDEETSNQKYFFFR
ncbi:Sugar_tr domain-containing protein [Cephalotus follicularis]|uniref:Sugar_tr domain-containing protein n=1 Tax=Cephalotus follicularis TaxID=3775 RepID=A0A1Q3BCS5_CEPFO|nr:Sugar_tr domain-containing protein [Cephalotus follicularis]